MGAMMTGEWVVMMARYNRWQNENLYGAADGLEDAVRRQEAGGWFGSIFGTLNHILWADRFWMHRLTGSPKPVCGFEQSVSECEDWEALRRARVAMDGAIVAWAEAITPAQLRGEYSWTSSRGEARSKPMGLVVTHVFNHQTHHRGQVHGLLTRFGVRPGDTDLFFMPG